MSLPAWTDDLTDIVSFRIVDGVLGKIDLLELLQGLIILRWHKRFPHLHAILYKGDSLPYKSIPLPHLPCI